MFFLIDFKHKKKIESALLEALVFRVCFMNFDEVLFIQYFDVLFDIFR